jgi:hypothetical protein
MPREFDGRAHFFEEFHVIVKTALGNADFVCAVGGMAGCFQMNEVVKPDETMQQGFHDVRFLCRRGKLNEIGLVLLIENSGGVDVYGGATNDGLRKTKSVRI